MAGDYISQKSTVAPEQLANDMVRNLANLNEAAREERLPSAKPPGAWHPPTYQGSPFPFGPEGNDNRVNNGWKQNSSSPFQTELQAQLDALNGTSTRHRLAASQDLADTVAKVNQDGLADDFKLSQIDNAGRIQIENTKGAPNHDHLSIDLSTGVISDQSGTRYVTTNDQGHVGFVPSEPVTIHSADKLVLTYDGNDNLTKVVLPDGSSIAKDGANGFSIYNAKGDALGPALNPQYDGYTLSYMTRDGNTLVGLHNGRLVTEDLDTGVVRSKAADQPGNPKVETDMTDGQLDYDVMAPAARQQNVQLTPPQFLLHPDNREPI